HLRVGNRGSEDDSATGRLVGPTTDGAQPIAVADVADDGVVEDAGPGVVSESDTAPARVVVRRVIRDQVVRRRRAEVVGDVDADAVTFGVVVGDDGVR